MGFLTKEEILSVRLSEVFEISTLEDGVFSGRKLKARPLKAKEQAEFIEAIKKHDNQVVVASLWVLYALVNPEDPSQRLFASGDMDPLLNSLDASELFFWAEQITSRIVSNGVKKELKNSEIPKVEATENSSISSV